ncbi:MAG: MCE family protein [Geobacter sp.]|nr:MCE family protein [Geobacter sp.]
MIKEEDPRFMHLRKKVAVFVVVAALFLVAVVVLIGRENDLFSPKYELGFTVPKGTGFTRGMPVKLSGFRIGRVKSISLNESAQVDIVLQIARKYQKWIRRDSYVKLVKEGLVGETVVEVSVGSAAQPVLEEHGKLTYVKTKGLDEIADELAEKVKPVLGDIRDIISYVNDPQGDVKQSLRNINTLTRDLEITRGHFDTLLLDVRADVHDVSAKFSTVLDDADRTVGKLDKPISELDRKLPGILEKAESTMGNAEKVSSDFKATAEQSLPKVPLLLDKSEKVLDKTEKVLDGTNTVIDAVKDIWPIRSHVKKPKGK